MLWLLFPLLLLRAKGQGNCERSECNLLRAFPVQQTKSAPTATPTECRQTTAAAARADAAKSCLHDELCNWRSGKYIYVQRCKRRSRRWRSRRRIARRKLALICASLMPFLCIFTWQMNGFFCMQYECACTGANVQYWERAEKEDA